MKIRPIGKRVLIKPKKAEEKTKGGIYIPGNADEKSMQAVVVEVGEDAPVKKGDTILYDAINPTEVKIDGEVHLIIKIEQIIAKVEG